MNMRFWFCRTWGLFTTWATLMSWGKIAKIIDPLPILVQAVIGVWLSIGIVMLVTGDRLMGEEKDHEC